MSLRLKTLLSFFVISNKVYRLIFYSVCVLTCSSSMADRKGKPVTPVKTLRKKELEVLKKKVMRGGGRSDL